MGTPWRAGRVIQKALVRYCVDDSFALETNALIVCAHLSRSGKHTHDCFVAFESLESRAEVLFQVVSFFASNRACFVLTPSILATLTPWMCACWRDDHAPLVTLLDQVVDMADVSFGSYATLFVTLLQTIACEEGLQDAHAIFVWAHANHREFFAAQLETITEFFCTWCPSLLVEMAPCWRGILTHNKAAHMLFSKTLGIVPSANDVCAFDRVLRHGAVADAVATARRVPNLFVRSQWLASRLDASMLHLAMRTGDWGVVEVLFAPMDASLLFDGAHLSQHELRRQLSKFAAKYMYMCGAASDVATLRELEEMPRLNADALESARTRVRNLLPPGHPVCPITMEKIIVPATTRDGKHTFEREAIASWVARNGSNPLTRARLTLSDLSFH